MPYPPIVDGIIRTVPHTGVMAAITAMLFTGNYSLYGGYLASYMLSTEVLSHAAKAVFVRLLPASITTRPGDTGAGACGVKYNKMCTSCSVYSTPNTRSKTPGFHSGHAASVMFNTVFWTLYSYHKGFDRKRALSIFLLLLALAVAVIHNRVVVSKCHTLLQVTVGAVIGSVMAVISYRVLNSIDAGVFPRRGSATIDKLVNFLFKN